MQGEQRGDGLHERCSLILSHVFLINERRDKDEDGEPCPLCLKNSRCVVPLVVRKDFPSIPRRMDYNPCGDNDATEAHICDWLTLLCSPQMCDMLCPYQFNFSHSVPA